MHKFSLLKSRTAAVVTGAAVVVGLGTTSGYAAALITSAQIANNTIVSDDVAANAIRSNEIADGTLRPVDLNSILLDKINQAGTPGVDGKSAYELAVAGGYDGTLEQWLLSLKGADGSNGTNGTNGTNGIDGKSAFELAQEGGYTGTLEEWLLSLKGVSGADGKSAYELAIDAGFQGTLTDWLASLQGKPGADGIDGTDGTDGTNGTDGASAYDIWLAQGNTGSEADFLASLKGSAGADAKYTGENWSVVDRNVIGGGLAQLRPGPSSNTFGAGPIVPPLGIGSLGIHTGSATDKTAFGNQVDFDGDLVSGLKNVGFYVYTTNENNGLGNNMPSITFEIDPNLTSTTSGYSSMVYTPANGAAGAWTSFDATDDAQGRVWGLTGAAGTATGCALSGSRCTWSELQNALNDGGDPATIYTVQITKGRDYAFSGAVDALTINDQVFDFEPFGVSVK